MNNQRSKPKGILSKILETGLKLWIKNKCKTIEELNLTINASNPSIIRGIVSSVKLTGSKIIYQDFPIDNIELISNEIRINRSSLPREFIIENNFKIKCLINFSGKSLEKALLSNRWKYLGKYICLNLLGIESLNELNINNNIIEIKALDPLNNIVKQNNFQLVFETGKILIKDRYDKKSIEIPIDKNINIRNAYLKDGFIFIHLDSLINQ